MDVNYLYHRHQVSLFKADNATTEDARRVHREFAERYAAQIAQVKSPAPMIAAA